MLAIPLTALSLIRQFQILSGPIVYSASEFILFISSSVPVIESALYYGSAFRILSMHGWNAQLILY